MPDPPAAPCRSVLQTLHSADPQIWLRRRTEQLAQGRRKGQLFLEHFSVVLLQAFKE